jgi:hypothetical protein
MCSARLARGCTDAEEIEGARFRARGKSELHRPVKVPGWQARGEAGAILQFLMERFRFGEKA